MNREPVLPAKPVYHDTREKAVAESVRPPAPSNEAFAAWIIESYEAMDEVIAALMKLREKLGRQIGR